MATLSPFQTLPLHIAKVIVRYFTTAQCHSGQFFDRYRAGNQQKVWKVLYGVSNTWRTLAISYFCKTATLNLSEATKEAQLFAQFPYEYNGETSVLYRHVKEVRVVVTMTDNLSQILDTLLAVWPKSLIFPCAITLFFFTSYKLNSRQITNSHPVKDDVTDKLFLSLARRIQSSLPCLREAQLENSFGSTFGVNPSVLMTKEQQAADFLKGFYTTGGGGLYRNDTPEFLPARDSFLLASPGFVSVECRGFTNVDFFPQLIARSAPVLQYLTVSHLESRDIKHLLYDEDGHPLTYPRLENISIRVMAVDDPTARHKAAENVAPFPVLRRFVSEKGYAFADETPFKGNSDTLDYLRVDIGSDALDILHKSEAFSNGRFSKLRRIVGHCLINERPPTCSDYRIKAALSLTSPATRILSLGFCSSYQQIVSSILTRSFLKNIRILYLENTSFTLSELLNLVKLFPCVTDLACLPGDIDPHLNVRADKPLPDDVYAKYYLASRHFRCLVLPRANRIATESMVLSAAVLAVLCPSFIVMSFPARKKGSYKKELLELLDCGAFDEHADRIKQLKIGE